MNNKLQPLTMNQINAIEVNLLLSKKHWSEKVNHCLGMIRSFYKDITEDNLQWFLEVYVPMEKRRLLDIRNEKIKVGEIITNKTPTDVVNSLCGEKFKVIVNPVIGVKYHLSWAYKGAVFILKRIEGDYCYLDNPKYPKKELIKAKITDLRGLSKRL